MEGVVMSRLVALDVGREEGLVLPRCEQALRMAVVGGSERVASRPPAAVAVMATKLVFAARDASSLE